MNIDGIIAGRGNGGEKARALAFLYDFLKACGEERDRLASVPGVFTRKSKRQRAAFEDLEHAREWVFQTFERIKQLEPGNGGRHVRSPSA